MVEMIVVGAFTVVGFVLGALTALLGATSTKIRKDDHSREDIS